MSNIGSIKPKILDLELVAPTTFVAKKSIPLINALKKLLLKKLQLSGLSKIATIVILNIRVTTSTAVNFKAPKQTLNQI